MANTPEQIINRGLTHIGAKHITSLDRPTNLFERLVTQGWPQWVESELTKRRWTFSYEPSVPLTLVSTDTTQDLPYVYSKPADILRLVRGRRDNWVETRSGVIADTPTLKVGAIYSVPTSEWPPLFVDVMEWRVAVSMVEVRTQSNSKSERALASYDEAVNQAGKANAFTIGYDQYSASDTSDDTDYTYISSRF